MLLQVSSWLVSRDSTFEVQDFETGQLLGVLDSLDSIMYVHIYIYTHLQPTFTEPMSFMGKSSKTAKKLGFHRGQGFKEPKSWFKGHLGVTLTVYPWYLFCFVGILVDYNL